MYHTETSSLQGFYSTDSEEMQELLSSAPWGPAHSHVEEARNTLAFAARAKEVTNTTHINIVVSDKVLVKQLQKEVARLEPELKVPDLASEAASSEALLQALPSWSE